ncbi:MAG: hypothetical protein JSW38_12405 [Dehalococcoidia bacterium]|nr:MAG: hypothetical protein JSV02_03410 [Dehalococcoidia bacterium]UCG82957.1 MAG: hypothetical protein JSW38_12405 [Dehalococcoidia bacterium]
MTTQILFDKKTHPICIPKGRVKLYGGKNKMVKRRIRRILLSMNHQGVSYMMVGTVLAGFLAGTIIGVPFSPLVLAIATFVSGAAAIAGVLAIFAPIIL